MRIVVLVGQVSPPPEPKMSWSETPWMRIGNESPVGMLGVDVERMRSVPTFYAGQPSRDRCELANTITLFVAIPSRVIHYLVWSFPFSLATGKVLWCAFVVVLTSVPIFILVTFGLTECGFRLGKIDHTGLRNLMFYMCGSLDFLSYPIGRMVYLVGRFMKFSIALNSFRSLPVGP
ncbi:hypothetical protein CPB86DRAFT_229531 [Serendipita vermifera]|nr:hypothetical protein CPB86DRAFT_229531 [Serendipita vermifera]